MFEVGSLLVVERGYSPLRLHSSTVKRKTPPHNLSPAGRGKENILISTLLTVNRDTPSLLTVEMNTS
jgi:hypothetical protein